MIVQDMDRSIQWYTDVFRFKVLNQTANLERGFKQANLSTGGVWIELIELQSAISQQEILKEKPKGSKISGFFKFGIKLKDFDAWISHFETYVIGIGDQIVNDPVSSKRMVILKDPDGNRCSLREESTFG